MPLICDFYFSIYSFPFWFLIPPPNTQYKYWENLRFELSECLQAQPRVCQIL